MDNLWILTEERPKNSVIKQILDQYAIDFNSIVSYTKGISIKPIVVEGLFSFDYIVEGVTVQNIDKITIKIVSGSSSFLDYLVVKQANEPINHALDNIIMAIEETKTSDQESRNTGVYQRASKFVFIDSYCPQAKKYMLYNEETATDLTKTPTNTNIFGTNMLLTLGVKFLGKSMSYFEKFESLESLIALKAKMKLPNKTNTPILITKDSETIYISGRLSKPKEAGNIGHDPNIGALSCIGYTIRKLGWEKEIVVTQHGVSQSYIDKSKRGNKCLFLFEKLGMRLQHLTMPTNIHLPEYYWSYSITSEKVASILLHLTCQYSNIHGIYENHAGCERGYFKDSNDDLIALPKKDSLNNKLRIPDLVLRDDDVNEIYNVEGKLLKTLSQGLEEIQNYEPIETEYILHSYPTYTVDRWLTIYGGTLKAIPHEKVLLYLNADGNVYINKNAPDNIKRAFSNLGFIIN
ncbi:MAG: hypothetical protein R3Y65_00655 [Bacillota bacterium]